MTAESDYVTVLATEHPKQFLVAVMTYHGRDEQYIQKKVSRERLTHSSAVHLAATWAAALHIEVRL